MEESIRYNQEIQEVVSLMDVLRSHEYLSRKYRCKGDAYYEIGNHRISMECHNLAAEEERRAKTVRATLEQKLGAAGSLSVPGAEEISRIKMQAEALPSPWNQVGGDFEDACFCARYPRWTRLIPGLWRAREKWKDDPRLMREAPRFMPVNPSWEP